MQIAPERLRARLVATTLERRVVWILGSARSGTTWLGAMVGQAAGATVVDEPLIGAHLAVPMNAVTSIPDPSEPLVHERSAARAAYVFAESAAAVWVPALRNLVLQRLALDATRSGRRRAPVVVKEPNGSLAAPLLLRALPRSRVLFLVRDGRDVVDSMLDGASGGWIAQSHGASIDTAERAAFVERRATQWVRTVEAVGSACSSHPPELVHRLRYEDLLADPVGSLGAVLRWMGVAVPEAVVADTVERLAFDNLPDSSRGSGRFARAATPGLWRENLTAEEQALLHGVMGPTLEAYGYEIG